MEKVMTTDYDKGANLFVAFSPPEKTIKLLSCPMQWGVDLHLWNKNFTEIYRVWSLHLLYANSSELFGVCIYKLRNITVLIFAFADNLYVILCWDFTKYIW